MTIGIDLDSVLADLQKGLIPFHNEVYGTTLVEDDYTDYNLSNIWQIDSDEVVKRVFEFYHSEYMQDIPLVQGSKEGIEYLLENHELVVITSRPHFMSELTNSWIDTYFPDVFKQVCLTNQFSGAGETKRLKSEVCKEVGATALIDDAPWYIQDALENGIGAYLMEAPWNKTFSLPGVTRLSSWDDISKHF